MSMCESPSWWDGYCTTSPAQGDCEYRREGAFWRNNIAYLRQFMANSTALTKTDRKLLEILQHDGRLTNLELAQKVNLSASACLRRVRALEEAGVIRRYVALLDAGRIG